MNNGIELEGSNILSAAKTSSDPYLQLTALSLKIRYSVIPRYVWFTKADSVDCINANTIQSGNTKLLAKMREHTIPLTLTKHDGLEIVSWSIERKRYLRKHKTRKLLLSFGALAQKCGDNIHDWYVCKTPVPPTYVGFDSSCGESKTDIFNSVLNGFVSKMCSVQTSLQQLATN